MYTFDILIPVPMKVLKLYLLSFFILLAPGAFSQARLTITALDNFPGISPDTAFSGTPYNNILITIKNTGNLLFQGEVDVLLSAGPGITDTLYLDSISGTLLAPGDSVIRNPPSYLFNSVHYDDGDNIVVVWPQARSGGALIDTLLFHVYYVNLLSIEETESRQILIHPNPGSDFIRLGIPEINKVEYVRIFDAEGRVFFESYSAEEMIRVKNWPAGLYFLEVSGKNIHYSGRLLIQ